MRFKLTVRYPNGNQGAEYFDLTGMQHYLATLSGNLHVLFVSEVVSIERVA
jgi:hypothetical protein